MCLDARHRGSVQKAMEPHVYENLMSKMNQVWFSASLGFPNAITSMPEEGQSIVDFN